MASTAHDILVHAGRLQAARARGDEDGVTAALVALADRYGLGGVRDGLRLLAVMDAAVAAVAVVGTEDWSLRVVPAGPVAERSPTPVGPD